MARRDGTPSSSDDEHLRRDLQRIRRILVPFLVVGITGMVLYVVAVSAVASAIAGLGYALAVAAAAVAFGSLLGFLFGIPKVLQGREGEAPSATVTAVPHAGAAVATLGAPRSVADNTNLEQISDWLTKLLIGATLTQLGKIADLVGQVAGVLATGALPGSTAARPFFAAVVVFWSIYGFFVGYLLTRRVLPMMWHNATQGLFGAETRAQVDDAYRARSQGREAELPAALRDIAGLRMDDVADAELPTWGRAQALREDYGAAVVAFEKVLTRSPGDAAAAEALMFAALYLPPPRGFEKTIAEGERIASKTAAMHAYLAAAYGQKYKWMLAAGAAPGSPDVEAVKQKAYEAAKRAIDLDPSWKDTVAGMLTASGGDDDLSAFREDPGFAKLVA